uniref:Uncharacterized protein n=1 Tax=Graphocephala atropunctata TaxID=36148 RepID=A0A1B6KV02_9HEMI
MTIFGFGLLNLLCLSFIFCDLSKELAYLHVVDESIISNLRMSPESRDDIFDAMEYFRKALLKVYDIVLHHDRWCISDATFVYKMGRPRFLSESIDTYSLSQLYEWNIGHFTKLEALMLEISQLWNNFVKQYEFLQTLYNF